MQHSTLLVCCLFLTSAVLFTAAASPVSVRVRSSEEVQQATTTTTLTVKEEQAVELYNTHGLDKRGTSMQINPNAGPVGTQVIVSWTSTDANVIGGFVGLYPAGTWSTSSFFTISGSSGSASLSTAGLAPGSYNVMLANAQTYVQVTIPYTISGSTTTNTPQVAIPTDAPSTGGGSTGSDSTEWLRAHNTRRATGGAAPLQWSTKLANSAQVWANQLATQCTLGHSGKSGVGENVAYGYSSIEAVMVGWADNEAQYYNNGQCVGGVCGHYTQVMWKSTNLVGCGTATCTRDNSPVYVCQYIRPGNCGSYDWTMLNSACPLFDDSSL